MYVVWLKIMFLAKRANTVQIKAHDKQHCIADALLWTMESILYIWTGWRTYSSDTSLDVLLTSELSSFVLISFRTSHTVLCLGIWMPGMMVTWRQLWQIKIITRTLKYLKNNRKRCFHSQAHLVLGCTFRIFGHCNSAKGISSA